MGAMENINQMKTLMSDCAHQTKRIWEMSETQEAKEKVKSRYRVVSDYMKRLEDVAGDVIDLCKDLIENKPKVTLDYYFNKVHDILVSIYKRNIGNTPWHRSFALLMTHYDEVKIYERDERVGDCTYKWDGEKKYLWMQLKGSKEFNLIDNYQGRNNALYEYCKLRNYFAYNLISRLCYYKDCKQGNVNINHVKELIIFADTLYLYIAMHNERKQLLKDAPYLGVKLEELQTNATEQQLKVSEAATEQMPVTIPPELDTEKGRELLQRVLDAGFCDENYVWDSGKWPNGDDVVALAYFAQRANYYLGLKKQIKGRKNFCWKPFDTLFTYRTKRKSNDGKTQLQIARTNFMRDTNSKKFEPEENTKEKILSLFK